MGILITIIVLIVIIWAIASGVNDNKKINERGEFMVAKVNNLNNFNATQKVIGVDNLYTFAVDEKKERSRFHQ